jgi:hypothetical protein
MIVSNVRRLVGMLSAAVFVFSMFCFPAFAASDKSDRVAVGILRYFPLDVKSVEAWHGYEFMVGNVPVQPTKKVSKKVLMDLVGRTVEVRGLWNPGKAREPGRDEIEQRPNESPEPVIRGDGIMAEVVIIGDMLPVSPRE